MAAVLLRRLLSSSFEDLWKVLPAEAQTEVKVQLLVMIQEEQDAVVRRRICDCASEFARNMLGKISNWI